VVVVAVAVYIGGSNGTFGDTGRALALRVASIGNSDVLEESSLEDRTEEWEDAARALRRSPIVGVGIGAPYGAVRSVYDLDLNRRVYAQRLYIHNSWLGAWLRLGLLGVAGFLLLLRTVWREGARARREQPTEAASLVLVGVLAVYGFALQALFQTTLTDRATIVALACATAFVELRPARTAVDQALVTTRSSR
jgi:O-antigen ligase